MTKLSGIIPPVATPLTESFELDEPAFKRQINRLVEAGMHGLFFLGSTGEVTFFNERQRQRILEIAVETVNGRVPVLSGVVDPATKRCIEHARQAAKAGVDALVLTAPFYTRTSMEEIGDHFRYVKDAVDKPILAYDIPVCVHIKLASSLVLDLAREKVIAGLKDSSGDDVGLRRIAMERADLPDFSVFTGSELLVDTALLFGVDGLVPGLGNVDPDGYVRLWNAAKAKDWATARKEQERLIRLFDMANAGLPRTSVGASGVGSFKTSLRLMDIFGTNLMSPPQRSLNEAETETVARKLREAGLL